MLISSGFAHKGGRAAPFDCAQGRLFRAALAILSPSDAALKAPLFHRDSSLLFLLLVDRTFIIGGFGRARSMRRAQRGQH
jgi:hypothetical protein